MDDLRVWKLYREDTWSLIFVIAFFYLPFVLSYFLFISSSSCKTLLWKNQFLVFLSHARNGEWCSLQAHNGRYKWSLRYVMAVCGPLFWPWWVTSPIWLVEILFLFIVVFIVTPDSSKQWCIRVSLWNRRCVVWMLGDSEAHQLDNVWTDTNIWLHRMIFIKAYRAVMIIKTKSNG